MPWETDETREEYGERFGELLWEDLLEFCGVELVEEEHIPVDVTDSYYDSNYNQFVVAFSRV